MWTVIDVSEHNGRIDWETAKNHIDGAIIRCGYGSDYESQDDDYWDYNVSECERLGIPYGVYLYSYAKDANMALSEAQHAIRLCKGHNLSYPLYYDVEETYTASNVRACARTFCENVKAAGFEPGFYSYRSLFNEYMGGFDDYTIWIADYGINDGYPHSMPNIGVEYDAWQYTSTAQIDGLSGNVDVSQFYFAPQGGGVKEVNIANIAATIHANMCEDDRFGYSWSPRWGTDGAGYATWEIEGREYTVKCGDYDCSSSVITAWSKALEGTEYEGALDDATYTGNMRSVFTSSGLFDVWDTDSTSAVRGDVYLNETHHTAMCQDGGSDGVYGYDCLSEFAINEDGGVYGGDTGDQTGREAYIHGFYWYPWDCTLHYNGKANYVKEDDMAISETDIHRIWEYTYMYGTPDEDSTLGKRGVDTDTISNRYNVLDAACVAARATEKRVDELDAKLDKIIKLLESHESGDCLLSKLVASTD